MISLSLHLNFCDFKGNDFIIIIIIYNYFFLLLETAVSECILVGVLHLQELKKEIC